MADDRDFSDEVEFTTPGVADISATDALLDALGRGEPVPEAGGWPDAGSELLAGLRAGLDLDYAEAAASGALDLSGLSVSGRRRFARGSVVVAIGAAVALSATGVAAAVSNNHSDPLFPLHKLIFGTPHRAPASVPGRSAEPGTPSSPDPRHATAGPGNNASPDDHGGPGGGPGDDHGTPASGTSASPDDHGGGGPGPDASHQSSPSHPADDHGRGGGDTSPTSLPTEFGKSSGSGTSG